MFKNIIKIDKKSDINKFKFKKSKNNKYTLILKNKNYDLTFKYGELIRINDRELSINEIQNYGGWKLALRGIIRDIWLKDIEDKGSEKIIRDKKKTFEKVITNDLKIKFIHERTNYIINDCNKKHGYNIYNRFSDDSIICDICSCLFKEKRKLSLKEWKQKNKN
ncbi:MAG: hypothetical protein H9Q65_00890 [Spiroplasma ixodetis]|nr:hypothetical protein [Spiroplasma ixodetis]MBP1527799.1 hypothetical protein [Spiroplasma ixodetis]